MILRAIAFFLALVIMAQFASAQIETTTASAIPAVDVATSPTPGSLNDVIAILGQVQSLIQTQARQLESQHRQLEHQQIEIEQLRHELAASKAGVDAGEELAATSAPSKLSAEMHVLKAAENPLPVAQPSLKPAAAQANAQHGAEGESSDAPLSIHFGNASLTPGGWVDFTAYYRSTDVGSGIGTAFASIPFNNTVQGGLSETRFTAQSSRITLRADETFGATTVFGYGEADFNGYLPSNGYVSTNSNSLRLRVYFANLSRGRWELLGGQSWSMLTPNRVGISPFLSEIYNTLHLDTNYQVGLIYARQAQLRAVYHFSKSAALGLSAENPEQFSGSAVTFPALFSTTETDLGSSSGAGGSTATPTLHPDLIAKLSADAGWSQRKWHFEVAGLLTPVAILTPASVTKSAAVKNTHEGGGISASLNLEVVKNLHLILTGFWSDGGGRYLGGLAPAFVVAQPGSSTSPFVAQLVHSGSGIAGVEWRATKSTVLSATYGGAYFGRAFSTDPSTGRFVGYGFTGSANSNNRTIGEGTFATQTTLWKRAGYGAVQIITQHSYIARTPWYVAPNTPENAHVYAGYANLRYVLP